MKLFICFIILILFTNCSFDNKTGIWKNQNDASINENKVFDEFQTLSSSNKAFYKTIEVNNNYKFKLPDVKKNSEWNDIFYDKTNNLKNFNYNDLNKIILKSKTLSRSGLNKFILFNKNNVIVSDEKGNLIIFSKKENQIISKFNFYKKKFKKIKKNLNLIVEDNIIYISDNIGFLYAFDYKKNKLVWAKNYKVPFRSNLKIFQNKLIAATQNNGLYFFNKTTGDIIRYIPTEETIFKNDFKNNLSLNEKYTYFLNTYGSLYAIENKSMRIKWFLNLNQSFDLNPSNLFRGNILINHKNNIILSSNQFTYIIDIDNGQIKHKKNFSSLIKPLVIENYLFLITKNNLLIATDLNDGKIIYSYDINQKVADFIGSKKKKLGIKNIMMLNGKLTLFLKNSYVLNFNINGTLEKLYKLPARIYSEPIIIDDSILFINNKNKISILD